MIGSNGIMDKARHIKETFKHAIIYSASGILGKLVGFIMLPIYAFELRGEGYGIIGMIDVILSVIAVLRAVVAQLLSEFFIACEVLSQCASQL